MKENIEIGPICARRALKGKRPEKRAPARKLRRGGGNPMRRELVPREMGVYTDEGKDGWNMRIMAVDFGDRRTGVAVSDLSGTLAGDTFVISDWQHERVAEKIAEEAQKRGVSRLVLGYPKNMDGSYGPRAEKSAAFAALLRERHGLDVVLWDERLTTVDAHRVCRGKRAREEAQGTVDAVAAALILESYLASIR